MSAAAAEGLKRKRMRVDSVDYLSALEQRLTRRHIVPLGDVREAMHCYRQ